MGRTPLANIALVVSALTLSLVLAPPVAVAAQHTTWTKRVSGTTNDLTSCSFVDTKNAWAVGLNGTILRTADGGATWKRQVHPVIVPLGSELHLTAVDFWDNSVGWAVGYLETQIQPTGVALEAVILKTANGGTTWVRQSHPDGTDRWLEDVVALSTTHAYAVGGADSSRGAAGKNIVFTENGGTTWQVEPYAPPATLFAFWGWRPNDFTRQFAAVGYPNTAIDNFAVGSVWGSAPSPAGAGMPNARLISLDEGYTGSGLNYERTWIAVGDSSTAADATGIILRATDLMDANWTAVTPPTTAQLRGVGAAAVHGDWWIVGTKGTVYHSHTGGQSWTVQANPAGGAHIWDVSVSRIDGKTVGTTGDKYYGDDYLLAVGTGGLIMTGKRPTVSLPAPTVPSGIKKNVAFSFSGYVKPRHVGRTAIDFEWYISSQKRWARLARVNATNKDYSGYTKYSGRFKPTVAGKWRVRAVHPEDYDHAAARGTYRYFTVK